MRDAHTAAKVAWLSSGRGGSKETYIAARQRHPAKGAPFTRRNLGACGVSAEAGIGPLLFWTECPGQEPTAIRGDGGRIPHHPPGRRAAARQDAHGRPPLGQRQALRYEGEQ